MRDAFEELARGFDRQERWKIATAAILLLLEEGESVRGLVRAVHNAKFDRSLDQLVEWAKAGVFREKALDGGEDDEGAIGSTGLKASSPAAPAKPGQSRPKSPADGESAKRRVKSK